ncbi:hypothetical protein GOV13_04355 [Candidatus Pacearchaeota archaeon]|nr:hypothetical protein [Candidatus Pacearchaeota archaeon]
MGWKDWSYAKKGAIIWGAIIVLILIHGFSTDCSLFSAGHPLGSSGHGPDKCFPGEGTLILLEIIIFYCSVIVISIILLGSLISHIYKDFLKSKNTKTKK